MTRYITSNELYHYQIPGAKWGHRRFQYEDGTYTPEGRERYGIGKRNLYKYQNGDLKAAGVSKYRRLKKKYDKAVKKVEQRDSDEALKEYRKFTPDIHNTSMKWDEKTNSWVKRQKTKEKPPSVQSNYSDKTGYSYNIRYLKAFEKLIDAKDKKDKIESKIEKLTGKNVADSDALYNKSSKIGSDYAKKLVDSASRQYIQNYVGTTKSQIKAYKLGINDLEKLFPNSTKEFNQELVNYIESLEEKHGGSLYKQKNG